MTARGAGTLARFATQITRFEKKIWDSEEGCGERTNGQISKKH